MNYLPLILGMALVTYIPRLIPLLALKTKKASQSLTLFLTFIPYTSLSILLIRGILFAEDEMKWPTLIGILASSLIAYLQDNLILAVLSGILAAFVTINFF